MLRDQVPGPIKSAGCCLMPRNDQRQNLVDQLCIPHVLAALWIARLHEQAENVLDSHAILPSASGDFKNDAAQGSEGGCEFHVARRFLGYQTEMAACQLVIVAKNEPQHHPERHPAAL